MVEAVNGGHGSHDSSDAHAGCLETVHRIYHFLDGELTDERRSEIERHLNDCKPCLEAFGFEAELRRVVSDRCKEQPPEGLRDRIAAALRDVSWDVGQANGGGQGAE